MSTTVTITLVVEGDPDDVQTVVEELLDQGAIQDLINDHDLDDYGELTVESAIASYEDEEDCDDDEPEEKT